MFKRLKFEKIDAHAFEFFESAKIQLKQGPSEPPADRGQTKLIDTAVYLRH